MKVLFASVIFSIFTINTAFAFGLAPPAVPPGIQYYLPITLTNYQGTAVTANTQIAIGTDFIGGNALSAANTLVTGFNALAYQQYEACNLQNVEFFFANGTVINSWLEGNIIASGTSNALCTGSSSPNSLSASANVLWWINYPWPTSFLPANTGTATTNTIYMGFASPSSSVVNGNTVGEAPTLSTGYGQYDNGANLFSLYFNGDTPTNDFNLGTDNLLQQVTGVTIGSDTNANVLYLTGYGNSDRYDMIYNAPVQNGNYVLESSYSLHGDLGNNQGVVGLTDTSVAVTNGNAIAVDPGFASSYFSQLYVSGGTADVNIHTQGTATSSWLFGTINYVQTSSTWYAFTSPQLYSPTGGYSGTTTNPLSNSADIYLASLGTHLYSYPDDLYLNWERARAYPPNDILPATTFGSVTLAGCSASITTPSNSIADAGQYESFTASENDCASPFTYNILVANSITPSVITHNDLLTGQTANSVTYTFQTTSTDTSNSPEEANVVVTDSGTNTVSSGYSSTFIINPALGIPSLSSSPSLPSSQGNGNTITFTATSTGGTSPYTYNYIITNTVTGALIANMLFTNVGSTSNSFAWTIPQAYIGNTVQANVIVTDSASTPETTNSAESGILTITYNPPSTPILSNCPSATKLELYQSTSCTASFSGGTSPYTYNWIVANAGNNAIEANSLITGVTLSSDTFTIQVTPTNFYGLVGADKFNVTVTDSHPTTVNSVYSGNFYVNYGLTTPSITPTNPTIDNGQSVILTGSWSDGFSPYTVNWYTGPSGNTCAQDSANVLATYSSVSATSNSITVTPTSTNSYCIGVTDSATTPVTQLSSNDVVFVNGALGTPTLTSTPTLPSTQNTGNTITFTASWSGGTSTYTANYLIVNTITGNLVANMLFTGITGTSNSFAWVIPSNLAGNTLAANVFITDSAYSPETTNSVKTGTLTVITGAPTTPTLSNCPSSAKLDVGQTVSCTASLTGGTSPYTYNWLISNSATDAITSNMLFTGVASTTNTFTYTTVSADTSNSPLKFNVIVTDSASTTVNSIYSGTFQVKAAMTTPTISSLNPIIDSGQSVTFSSTWSGGTPDYTAKLYSSTTSPPTCNTGSTLVQTLSSLTSGSASFSSVSPTSTTYYCIFITDSATTAVTTNSVNSEVTINPVLSTPTISPSNPSIDTGQSVTFSSTWSGGTSTYGASLYSSATSTCNQESTLVQQQIGLTSNTVTFSALSPTSSTYYCSFITDNTPETFVNSNTISKGIYDPYGVAFSPDGSYAYVTNYNSNNVVIINTVTNTVTGAITAGFNGPQYVAIAPSGTYAYVTNYNSNNVVIINTASNSVTGSITAGFNTVSYGAYAVAFSPSGTYAYVTNSGSNNVVIINTATNSVTDSITTGFSRPVGIAISPDGSYAYVTNAGSGNVVIINTATNSVTGTVSGGDVHGPYGVAFSPSGTYAYYQNFATNNVPIINTATNSVTWAMENIPTGYGVAFSPSGAYAYITEVGPVLIVNTGTATTNSINSEVTVNPALGIPTLSSSPALPSTQNTGNTITFTASWTGGTSTYTANYLIVNTITGNLVANMLFTGITGTSNSFAWTIPSADVGNTVQANVIITDSASTPETTNSVKSGTLTITALSPSVPAVIVPANILYYIPIKFTNSQTAGISNPFQLATTVNSLEYENYEASNLQNIEFFYANGTIVPSWLEGNSLNSAQSTNLYTSENTVYWLNVVGNFLPASSSNTLYMGFAATGTNLLNGAGVGEAPLLSSTYGLYDNGNSVFLNYYNGASDSGWTIVGTAGVKTNIPSGSPFGSNAFYANSANGDYEYTNFGYASSENVIIQYFTYTTGLGDTFFSASSSGAGTISRLDSRGGVNYIGLAKSASWASWNCPNSGITAVADTWYTWTILVLGGTSEVGDYFSTTSSQDSYPISSYGTQINALSTTYSDGCGGGTETYAYGGGYVGLIGDALGSTYITYWNGIMARAYPPNGIMPTASFGAINGISIFSETGLPNNGELWSVTYNGASLNSIVPSNVVFSEAPGSYSYSVPNVITGGNTYVPSPSSGTLYTANTLAITFTISASNTCSFTVSNTAINFGPINPGTDIATQNAILITNTGNTASNVLIDGSNWASSPYSFGVTNTVWSWSSGVAYASANQLTSTTSDTKVTLGSSNSKNILFGVGTPAGQAPGTYSQTINIISSC